MNLPSLQRIGDTMNMGLMVIDLKDHQLLYRNAALEKILGLNKSSILTTSAELWNYSLQSDLEFIKSALADLVRDKSVQNVEFNISVGEKLVYISCDATHLQEEDYIIAMVRDITKEKEHETYIATYGAKKDALLEMLGHHLSGTLSLSNQVIDHLEKKTDENQTAKKHIDFIKDSNAQCIRFINDLLKEEHLISERIFVAKNRFDVMEKINAILDQFNHSHPAREITVLSAPDHLFISGDDVKFFQIMNNLIINAIKFTPEDKSISLSVEQDNERICVAVADQGIGIPNHLKPLIFQKYTPAGRTGLSGEKSIGIGLSIVKRLAELMKGEIQFESEENQGSTFTLIIPKI